MINMKKMISMITLVFTILTMTFTSSFADDQPSWEKGTGDVNVLLYYRPGGAYDRMNQSLLIPLLGDSYGEVQAI